MGKTRIYFFATLISSFTMFSCEKDNENQNPNYFRAKVSLHQETLVNEIPEYSQTEFSSGNDGYHLLEYSKTIKEQKYTWNFRLWIPDHAYIGEGEYTLGPDRSTPNIYFYADHKLYEWDYWGDSRSDDQFGKFELYNETESSISIRYSDVVLYNHDNYTTMVSGDLLIRKKQE